MKFVEIYCFLTKICFPSTYNFFKKKNLEDINPFYGSTDTPVLDFW